MKAKFDGTCRTCGGVIHAGDEIKWSRTEGSRHVDADDCREALEWAEAQAEQAAEMRFEMGCAAHMAGTGYVLREGGFDDL